MGNHYITLILGIVLAGLLTGFTPTEPQGNVATDLPLPTYQEPVTAFSDHRFLPGDLELAGEQFWNPRTKSYMTDEQIRVMLLAYEIGEAAGGYGELMQAIVLQESIAALLPLVADTRRPPMGRSYGVAMVKPIAAQEVFNRYPELNAFRDNAALIYALKHDHRFNLQVAVRYWQWIEARTQTLEEGLVAYNLGLQGSRGVDNPADYRYTEGIRANWEEVVRPFNQAIRPIGYRIPTLVLAGLD